MPSGTGLAVLGANTFRQFAELLGTGASEPGDWNARMRSMPTTVVSTTLQEPLDWPDATVVGGDAVGIVARLKDESETLLRSHGSLSLNRTLLAAGLVDRLQVTVFPVGVLRRTAAYMSQPQLPEK